MEMKLIESTDALTHVALRGTLDIEGLHDIDSKFHAATAARGKSAIVDLAGVDFVASLGMGMFISCARSLGRKGAQMVLAAPQPNVEEALRAAGVHAGIPIVKTVAAARVVIDAAR